MSDAREPEHGIGSERVLLSIRPHPVTILLRSFWAIVVLIVYAALLREFTVRAGGARVAAIVLWLAVGMVAARLAVEIARWLGRRYVLTDRRITAWDGVFRRWRVEITLGRIQNIVLHRTLVERVLGLGTIGVSSAAGGAGLEVLWISVDRPGDVLERVSRARDSAADGASRARLALPEATAGPDRPGGGPGAPVTAPGTSARRRPLVIGLVGGIGSGKSAVAAILESLGAVVSDSDAQARHMLQREDVRRTLVQWWGERVLTPEGVVDRRVVAEIVFRDPGQRRRLEGLIHPLLRDGRESLKRDAAIRGVPMVVIDAPLLFEAGVDAECDEVWFVDAPVEQRLSRVRASRGWDEAELTRRESAQMAIDQKRARATRTIENVGDMDSLRRAVSSTVRGAMDRHAADDRAAGAPSARP